MITALPTLLCYTSLYSSGGEKKWLRTNCLSNWSCKIFFALVDIRAVEIPSDHFPGTSGTIITKFAPKPNRHFEVPQLVLCDFFFCQDSESFWSAKAQLIVNILSSANVISFWRSVMLTKLASWAALWYGELITDKLIVWACNYIYWLK